MMAWRILMSRHGHTFGSQLHMHGPIHSKINMVDLCQSPNTSIGLHWNLDQQRPLGHFKSYISLIHHWINLKCSIHDHELMMDMLTQSIDDIILAPPINKQMSVASIWKVGFPQILNASHQMRTLHVRCVELNGSLVGHAQAAMPGSRGCCTGRVALRCEGLQCCLQL
ncbi:hypothetical protein GOODEAATRI_031772 [Goodea atripinnis]|uniref:Uncharacterized protein n=1 Tax=Goodea atripinnis TaxID=208336 RepID=A0ABV0NFE4_9TELE